MGGVPDTDLVTTAEATHILGRIDRSTLTRWVTTGRLVPIRKLPGRTGAYVFERADVERLRDELEAEAS